MFRHPIMRLTSAFKHDMHAFKMGVQVWRLRRTSNVHPCRTADACSQVDQTHQLVDQGKRTLRHCIPSRTAKCVTRSKLSKNLQVGQESWAAKQRCSCVHADDAAVDQHSGH